MITESVSIIAIVLIIIFTLIRSKHADYAVSIVPTLIVPTGHIFVMAFMYVSRGFFNFARPAIIFAFADIVLLAITCALFALFSHKIKNQKTRYIYTWTMIIYSVILTWAFIYQTLNPILI